MKKVLLTIIAGLFFAAVGILPALADSRSDIDTIKQQMADLQKQLADLEAKQAASAAASTVKFGGYFRGRIDSSQAENSTLEAAEIAFEPRWDSASDKIHGEVHLWFYPNNSFYLESAMMTFDNSLMGKGGKLIAGKTRNFCYGITPTGGNRLLSDYSLYSDTFTHDRVVGFQALNKMDNGKVDLNVAIVNGFYIGVRGPGIALTSGNIVNDFTINSTNPWKGTTAVLANRDKVTEPMFPAAKQQSNPSLDLNNSRAVSLRLGGQLTPELNIGLSAYMGKLTQTDLDNLTLLTGYIDTNKELKHTMMGLDAKFKKGPWVVQGEFTDAKISNMKYTGYQATAGYSFTPKNTLYAQYGAIKYDFKNKLTNVAPTFILSTHSADWDKSQLSFSFKHILNKKAWLVLEHELNYEKVPAGTINGSAGVVSKIDNNVTFLEYFISL